MKELLRRFLRPVVTFLLRVRSRPFPMTAGSRSVIIAPHQDDESLGCAGLILSRRQANLPVHIVYITDGAGSHPGHPRLNPQAIAQLRRAEAITALQKLAVGETALHFLDAPDGTLAQLTAADFERLAVRLSSMLASLQPNELFVPCRDDGSSEHTAAFQLTLRALQLAGIDPRIFEYPVWARWRPQRLFRLGLINRRVRRLSFPQLAAHKRAALAAYASQTEPTLPWPDPVLPRGFVRCFESAEEFYFER